MPCRIAVTLLALFPLSSLAQSPAPSPSVSQNVPAQAWRDPAREQRDWPVYGGSSELAAKGIKNTGTENYGGPMVTAGGLLFIAATNFDKKLRAFDKATGELLWETTLPFSANGTPATYEVNGRQFIVVAAGGGKDPKSAAGGVYIAFALPRSDQ